MDNIDESIFLNGKYFKWEITNQYGYTPHINIIREITIDNIIDNDFKNEDVFLRFNAIVIGDENKDNYIDSFIYFTYYNGCLTIKKLKFKISLREADELIMKILNDNEWMILPKYELDK